MRNLDDSTLIDANGGTFFFTPQGIADFVTSLDDKLKERGWSHGARKELIEASLDVLKAEVSR